VRLPRSLERLRQHLHLPHAARPRRSGPRLELESLESRTLLTARLLLDGPQTLAAGANVQAATDPNTLESEMVVDVNPTNPLNVAGFTHDILNLNSHIQLFFSMDGGATWTRRLIGGASGDGLINDGLGSSFRFDPAIKFDANGDLFVCYGAGNRVVVGQSHDGGNSMSNFYTVINEGGIDKFQLTTGPSNFGPAVPAVYVTLTRNLGDGQHVAVSGFRPDIDAGFTAPANISGAPNTALFSQPAVGPGGEVYVSWQNYGAGQIRLNRNLNFWGGGAWGSDVVVATPRMNLQFYRVPAQPNRGVWTGPVIDVDRSGGAHDGRIYVAYCDLGSGGSIDLDVKFTFSDDQGLTWAAPGTVAGTPATEFLPWLAVDQDTGTVNVAYYTTAGLPNDQVRIQLASSTDGGASFAYTIVASQPTRAATVGYAGDMLEYTGLAAVDGTAHMFWADNRGFTTTFHSWSAYASTWNAANNLAITGTGGPDTIVLRSSAANPDFAEVVVNGQLEWAGLWASVGTVTIDGLGGGDTINIEDTLSGTPVTVNARDGDTINVAPTAQSLDHIQGDITVAGQGGTYALNLFDQNDPAGDTYTLAGTTVTRTGAALITYDTAGGLVLNGGNGASGTVTYQVESTAAAAPVTINGGPGANVFRLSPTATDLSTIGTLTINSASAADAIVLYDNSFVRTYTVSDNSTTVDGLGSFNLGYTGTGPSGEFTGSIYLLTDPASSVNDNTVFATLFVNSPPPSPPAPPEGSGRPPAEGSGPGHAPVAGRGGSGAHPAAAQVLDVVLADLVRQAALGKRGQSLVPDFVDG
jgi:hypothetical protein